MAVLPRLKNFVRFPRILRNVANSSKNASTEAASGAKPRSQEELSKMVGETMKKQWKSYGLYQHDKKLDYFEYHASVFVCAIFCVGICWFNYYRRDYSYRDWARREAMLLLLEREEQVTKIKKLHAIRRLFLNLFITGFTLHQQKLRRPRKA